MHVSTQSLDKGDIMTEESNLLKHARQEFAILGWPGDEESQKWVCDNILELLRVFAGQEHSGTSAPYVLQYFDKLAHFEPISPLTGKDDEWNEVGEGIFQNRRDSEVFKENGDAYWIEGKIFRDCDGCTYTSINSRVSVEFPWIKPKPEIVDVEQNG